MKARIIPQNRIPVNTNIVLEKILNDKELARELWEKNYTDRASEATGTTFEEWYENIRKASFLSQLKELTNAYKQRGNRYERRHSESEK